MDRTIDNSLANKGLLIFLSISLLFYGVSGLVTYPVIGGWFADLQKPSWNPPNELFGPVWGRLFLLMAIAGWTTWKKVGIDKASGFIHFADALKPGLVCNFF
jgi:translocator protein